MSVVFQAESVDQTDAQLKKERLYQVQGQQCLVRYVVKQKSDELATWHICTCRLQHMSWCRGPQCYRSTLTRQQDILCKTMQDAVYQEMQLLEAQILCDQERYLRNIAMADTYEQS